MIDVSTECFKSQIDWKVFNFINDYCTRLEDDGIFHTTYVDVCYQDEFGNKTYYNIYNDHGGFYKVQDYKIERYKKYLEKNDFVYTLMFDRGFDKHVQVIHNISKNKTIEEFEYVVQGNFIIVRFKKLS